VGVFFARLRRHPDPDESRSAISRSSFPFATPWTSPPSPTMSRTFIRGLREEYGSWKTICIWRRFPRSSSPSIRVMSSPVEPDRSGIGVQKPDRQAARVVFPHPDSPTRPSVFPGETVRETPSTARTRRSSPAKNDFRTGNVL